VESIAVNPMTAREPRLPFLVFICNLNLVNNLTVWNRKCDCFVICAILLLIFEGKIRKIEEYQWSRAALLPACGHGRTGKIILLEDTKINGKASW
jgi:hypothetical protein